MDDLSDAIERARVAVNDPESVRQPDLRDAAEAAINALQSLEATRRFLANPLTRGEPLSDRHYDRGQELQLSPPGPQHQTASLGGINA